MHIAAWEDWAAADPTLLAYIFERYHCDIGAPGSMHALVEGQTPWLHFLSALSSVQRFGEKWPVSHCARANVHALALVMNQGACAPQNQILKTNCTRLPGLH